MAAKPDSFRSFTSAYYSRCESVALELVEALAGALGSPAEPLLAAFEGHTSYLRLNYYPTCPDPSPADTPTGPPVGHFAISHHSDAGAVTVLLMDGVSGLQVEKDGEWHLVEAEAGDWIINIGDVVQVWSNDRYKAPLHRVLASATEVRYSAPFFLNPSFEATYAPLTEALETNALSTTRFIGASFERAGQPGITRMWEKKFRSRTTGFPNRKGGMWHEMESTALRRIGNRRMRFGRVLNGSDEWGSQPFNGERGNG